MILKEKIVLCWFSGCAAAAAFDGGGFAARAAFDGGGFAAGMAFDGYFFRYNDSSSFSFTSY